MPARLRFWEVKDLAELLKADAIQVGISITSYAAMFSSSVVCNSPELHIISVTHLRRQQSGPQVLWQT